MLKIFFVILVSLALYIVSGCTKPAALPALPERTPLEIENIVTWNKITALEVRKVFRAINRSGSLNSLKPYIEDASYETLSSVAELLDRRLYRDYGLTDFFSNSIHKQRFTAIFEAVKGWSGQSDFSSERSLLLALLKYKELPAVLKRDANMLGDEFFGEIHRISNLQGSVKSEAGENLKATLPSASELVSDLKKAFSNLTVKNDLIELSRVLHSKHAGTYVLRALEDARNLGGYEYFEGFGLGITKMIETNVIDLSESSTLEDSQPLLRKRVPLNELDELLSFAKTANQDSRSLFRGLQESLAQNGDLLSVYTSKLQQGIRGAIAGWITVNLKAANFDKSFWQKLSQGPDGQTKEFDQIFDLVLNSIGRVVSIFPEKKQGSFENNLPIYLNAFALSKWIEQISKLNPSGLTLMDSSQPIHVNRVPINFAIDSADGVKFPLEPQLNRGSFKKFYPQFKKYVEARLSDFSSFRYQLTNSQLDRPFSRALLRAVSDCENTRPFGQVGPFFNSLIFNATHVDSGSGFHISQLGTRSLLDSLNSIIKFLPLNVFRGLKSAILDELQGGDLSSEDRKVFVNFLPEKGYEKERDLIDRLLTYLPALKSMDVPVSDELPSAFELYYKLLNFTADSDLSWISHLLSFLSESKFFSGQGDESTSAYPAFYQVARTDSISKGLYALALIDPLRRAKFLQVITDAFGDFPTSGLKLHITLLETLINSEKPGVISLVDRLLKRGLAVSDLGVVLSEEERQWLIQFLKSEDFNKVWALVRHHGSIDGLRKLTQELLKLCRAAELERPLELLKHIHDNRIQELATIALKMVQTKELEKLLMSLEILLNDPETG